jgi:hypothetical protein
MKTFLKIIFFLVFTGLIIGCKSYRPIEKVTVKSDPSISKNENLLRQLNQLSKNEKIEVTLVTGETHLVNYQSHTADKLLTTIAQKDKKINSDPLPKIFEMNTLSSVKVWRTDYFLTLAIPGAALIAGIIYLATWDLNLDLDWDQTN